MTILHSKTSQQGDTDEPPPKKKSKKSKSLLRTQPHVNSHPTTSTSGAGPSHLLPEQIGLYSYLSSPQEYFTSSDSDLPEYYGDQEILQFKLDKFDVGCDRLQSEAGTSQCKTINKIYNPDSLEYYIYGRGLTSKSISFNSKQCKRDLPDVDLIEVISSEEIINNQSVATFVDVNPSSGSLLDDINNFDIDDKFGEIEKFQQEAIWENSKMYHMERSLEPGVMVNGYDKVNVAENQHYDNRLYKTSPAASLSNLGNTCFLNSVLYTLRFAPNFLHNLHHLVNDMNNNTSTMSQVKQKTSSLGRNMNLSWSANKDLNNVVSGADLATPAKTKKQIVTEKLHEVYIAMHSAESKEHIDPFHPDVFLTALREVNPIFEGNQQQDAHELLVCLLDIFRETCQASARQAEARAAIQLAQFTLNSSNCGDTEPSIKITNNLSPSSFNKSWGGVMAVRNSLKVRTQECLKSRKHENPAKKKNKLHPDGDSMDATDSSKPEAQCCESPPCTRVDNFVAQDFEGVMVLKTTCLECENTTEKKEPFADICVPIKTDTNDEEAEETVDPANASELYQKAVVTDEFLRDKNKYYCEECMRYNEARRSVRYQTLPRLLTLQLKRFSSTYGAMSKVTQFMPTPMTLSCFCEECLRLASKSSRFASHHSYELYGVIMHLGPNMAGGHYIAYVKTTDNLQHYKLCNKEKTRKTSSLSSESGKSNLTKTNNKFYNLFKTKNTTRPTSYSLNEAKSLTSSLIPSPPRICRSLQCCGVKSKMADSLLTGSEFIEDDFCEETLWMACDDDNVKLLSANELENLLSKNSTSNATPYLLFYGRTD